MELERGDEPKKKQEEQSSSKVDEYGGYDNHVTEIYKDYELYLATKTGNLDDFNRFLGRDCVSVDKIMSRLSPVGNTYLHIAAKHGNEDVVTLIAAVKPSMVLSKNFDGETALHIAAKAGNASVVEALVKVHRDTDTSLLRLTNERGYTALHEALLNDHDSIAECLISEDSELSYCTNEEGVSALYLAAGAGFVNCIALMLRLLTDEERVNELFVKRSLIRCEIA